MLCVGVMFPHMPSSLQDGPSIGGRYAGDMMLCLHKMRNDLRDALSTISR